MKRLRVRVRASFQSMPHCTYTHTMSDVHESRQHDTTCCVKCCARKYQGRSALASQHPPERGVEPFQLHFPLHDLPCSFAFAASSGALPKAIAAAE